MGGRHHTMIDDDEKEEGDEMCICIQLTCTPMNEMNIEKQYMHQKLVNGIENRLKDL